MYISQTVEMPQKHWVVSVANALFNILIMGLFALGTFTACILLLMLLVPSSPKPCDDPKSFTCLDQRVKQCVASEQYTKDQCVILVGGNK